MKDHKRQRRPASIAKTRWAAYAAASAATALAGSQTADAAIHYSGLLHETFPPNEDHQQLFQLVDQTGVSLFFERLEDNNLAACSLIGGSGPSGGIKINYFTYPQKLSFGIYVSGGFFWDPNHNGTAPLFMAFGSDGSHTCSCTRTYFGHPGIGFVGFRFNTGAGLQYGGYGSE